MQRVWTILSNRNGINLSELQMSNGEFIHSVQHYNICYILIVTLLCMYTAKHVWFKKI